MNVSRRRFFEGVGQQVAETVRDRLDELAPGRARAPHDGGDPGWVEIGSLADYPPGRTRELPGRDAVVSSRPEGIQVVSGGVVRPLRIEGHGALSFQPEGIWPGDSALSVLTGERIQYER